jgi:23S rRNA pseudouridine2457 synthase
LILLFNKPFRVMSQFSAMPGKATLADYIRQPGVYPAGRLDYDSEGLLLLTDDGALQQRISHPRHKLLKIYLAQVEGEPNASQITQLRTGVVLNDGPSQPAQVRPVPQPDWLWLREPPIRVRKAIPTAWLEIGISEGRNRQVRRMTAAVGLPTLRLIRTTIGPWTLADLLPGEARRAAASALFREQ